MSHIVVYTKTFQRAFERLTKVEKALVMAKIDRLEDEPFYPSLRSKKLKGNSGCYESRVNRDIRIIWRYQNGKIILLINVGHHDVTEKY